VGAVGLKRPGRLAGRKGLDVKNININLGVAVGVVVLGYLAYRGVRSAASAGVDYVGEQIDDIGQNVQDKIDGSIIFNPWANAMIGGPRQLPETPPPTIADQTLYNPWFNGAIGGPNKIDSDWW
jgi:hypothetical protein